MRRKIKFYKMEDIITGIQREVVLNTANINQLQLDVNQIQTDIEINSENINQFQSHIIHLETLIRDVSYEVADLKTMFAIATNRK